MKMKFLSSIALSVLMVASLGAAKKVASVDLAASELAWKGTKVTGFHTGTIGLKSGELVFDGQALVGGNFVIDMDTIETTDLSGGQKTKLDGHLRSDDFFAVSKFPSATISIASVKPGSGAGAYQVVGDLTIKGVTHPVTFDAKVTKDGGVRTAVAKVIFDRTKYDIQFRSGNFFENLGDKLIYDEIELAVTLVVAK